MIFKFAQHNNIVSIDRELKTKIGGEHFTGKDFNSSAMNRV
jgi:hypothetical protein